MSRLFPLFYPELMLFPGEFSWEEILRLVLIQMRWKWMWPGSSFILTTTTLYSTMTLPWWSSAAMWLILTISDPSVWRVTPASSTTPPPAGPLVGASSPPTVSIFPAFHHHFQLKCLYLCLSYSQRLSNIERRQTAWLLLNIKISAVSLASFLLRCVLVYRLLCFHQTKFWLQKNWFQTTPFLEPVITFFARTSCVSGWRQLGVIRASLPFLCLARQERALMW